MRKVGSSYYLICAIYLFTLADFKVTNYIMNKSIQSNRKENVVQKKKTNDITIYVGFANNPFGPSTRFIGKGNVMQNISFAIPKYKPGTDSEENVVDTGQTDIVHNDIESRSKRGVFQLYNMVKCATGCDPLIYKGYGCYCGFLGSGRAVDGVDKCCKRHDWCYNNVGCPPFFEYIIPYLWKCYRNRPLCAIDHGEWGGPNSCAKRLCECDRILSECLSKYPCPSSRALCHSSPWRLLQNAFMIF